MAIKRERVAILGGGMAGLAAAWRLSQTGWQDEFDSITVYQRGWRLGGKGASTRGMNGRIQEHGLHVWLGWYHNAFGLLRECYEELDRPSHRPNSPIQTTVDAFVSASEIGMADRFAGDWSTWVTQMPSTDRRPGLSGGTGRDMTLVALANQAIDLLIQFFRTFPPEGGSSSLRTFGIRAPIAVEALVREMGRLMAQLGTSGPSPAFGTTSPSDPSVRARDQLEEFDAMLRTWYGFSLAAAAVRGIVSDRLLSDPNGFRTINDEEYIAWVGRHGGPPDLINFSVVRSLYDMVFAFVDGDTARPSLSAGTAVLFGGKTLFDYDGSIFWKMTAGMGDVVFAPIYEALVQRGVTFEFFHRVDSLRPSRDGRRIEAIEMGRQVFLQGDADSYDPLVMCKGLPCFPDRPLVSQLKHARGMEHQPFESHWCPWPDAEKRVLLDGTDFDRIVFAIPPGMARRTCSGLAMQRAEWHDMLSHLGTVATQSFQIWLRETESDLGWSSPSSTLSGFEEPFSTWSCMPQTIGAEDWPSDDRPRAIAYFCGAFTGRMPRTPVEAEREHDRVRAGAVEFLERSVRHLLPGAGKEGSFNWDLLCGSDGLSGQDRFASQFWTANVDASDRYVQSLPGTDRFRLRPDESGYDNLVLAGDWTDSGLNAGCIEAAAVSGLQAANGLRGRPRSHQIKGYFLS